MKKNTQCFKNGNVKRCVLLTAALMMLPQAACAVGADADVSKLGVPTLDKLHQEGILDPSKPQYPESFYTLTPVETPPSAANSDVITKFQIVNGSYVPKYFKVELKSYEFNKESSYDSSLTQYYKIETDAEGNKAFVPASSSDGKFVYYVDPAKTAPRHLNVLSPQGDVNENYIGNSIVQYGGSNNPSGAAITNRSSLDNINGDFLDNYVSNLGRCNSGYEGYGGALGNIAGNIGDINGNFINNYVNADAEGTGGAIYSGGSYRQNSVIGDINGKFIGNRTDATISYGGALANGSSYRMNPDSASIGQINADFINNYASAKSSYAGGGAVYNGQNGMIAGIKGNFIGNYSYTHGGHSTYYASAIGGAIANKGEIESITGDFIGNYSVSNGEYTRQITGGAINNDGVIYGIEGDFIGNYIVAKSGASSPSSGQVDAGGGAIFNSARIIAIVNSSFINNFAKSETDNYTVRGGAIYTKTDLSIVAKDGGTSFFQGNYVDNNGVVESNAIYVENGCNVVYDRNIGKNVYTNIPTSLSLVAVTNGNIILNDKIQGDANEYTEYYEEWNVDSGKYDKVITDPASVNYNLILTGDSTGKIFINNVVENADINLDGTNAYLGADNLFNTSHALKMNSGSLSMVNAAVGTMHLPEFHITGSDISLSVDVNLAEEKMDRITADNYHISQGAALNVDYLNLLSDSAQDVTKILFAPEEYASSVNYAGANPVAYSPIYKYQVSYSQNPEDNLGYFTFLRGSNSSNPSDSFNPSVLSAPVVQQAGAYTSQLQTFNYAFNHLDTFMALPYLERMAIKNQNRYALSPTGDATDVGTFSPLFTKSKSAGFWVKPYSSFESVPLKNGPKVQNINYGTLIGYDSQLTPIANGFDRVLTGYLGYNGASQHFQGISSFQNGGILGGTLTLYKNNFFNAVTVSAGATAGESTGMYGSENYTMLVAGIADKFGYNFGFFEDKLIVQPGMLMSYTFVNTFDYTNAAGIRIKSDPLNALQLAPGIKIIGNLNDGWQPYLAVNMIWNLLDKSDVTANDVRIPSMSIKPYVEYGAGLQRRWGENFTAYLQTMLRSGGRNGVSLTAGFRWSVGKD